MAGIWIAFLVMNQTHPAQSREVAFEKEKIAWTKSCRVKLQDHLGKAEQSSLKGGLGLYVFVLSSDAEGWANHLCHLLSYYSCKFSPICLFNLLSLTAPFSHASLYRKDNYLMYLVCFFTYMCSLKCEFLFFAFWFSTYSDGIMLYILPWLLSWKNSAP